MRRSFRHKLVTLALMASIYVSVTALDR